MIEKTEFEHYPKAERIEKELQQEIAEGKHGTPGTPFMTTRFLMTYKNISLKTAHRILGRLCATALLEVQGKRYYLKKSTTSHGKTTVGLLLTRLDTPYFSNLAANIEEIVRELGAEISIAVSDYDSALERQKLENFCERGVAGIIACPWGIVENEEVYKNLPVPYVLIGRALKHSKADTILVDNAKAARSVAKHLIDCDCEDLLYIGPEKLTDDQRLQGFRLGLLENDKSLAKQNIIALEDSESDMECVRKLLIKNKKKLGIFCYHDLYAARVINICHEEKIPIPEKVAVAGFDNLPVAAAIYPPLTSVSYPLRSIAQMACEILFTGIRRQCSAPGMLRYLDSKLIIRSSTCKN